MPHEVHETHEPYEPHVANGANGANGAASRMARCSPVLLWVVPALWSSNHIIAWLAPGVVAPHLLTFGRCFLALVLILPFVAAGLWQKREIVHAERWHLLVLGALGM